MNYINIEIIYIQIIKNSLFNHDFLRIYNIDLDFEIDGKFRSHLELIEGETNDATEKKN